MTLKDLRLSPDRAMEFWIWTFSGTEEREEDLTRRLPTRAPTCLAFVGSGRRLVTGTSTGRIELWDVATGRLLEHTHVFATPVAGISCSSNQKFIAVAGKKGGLVLLAMDGLTEVGKGVLPEPATSISAASDGRRVLCGTHSAIILFDFATGAWTATRAFGSRIVPQVMFLADDRHAVSWNRHALALWEVPESGELAWVPCAVSKDQP